MSTISSERYDDIPAYYEGWANILERLGGTEPSGNDVFASLTDGETPIGNVYLSLLFSAITASLQSEAGVEALGLTQEQYDDMQIEPHVNCLDSSLFINGEDITDWSELVTMFSEEDD